MPHACKMLPFRWPGIARTCLLFGGSGIWLSLAAQTPSPDQRADAMLRQLTLPEKIELLGGEASMFIRAEPKIGLPQLKMSDGPLGVRTWGPSTAYAGGIGLAASWDVALAREVGASIARDARARGVNFLLGPGVNIYRLPLNGRNFEYFGEDPYLAGQLAAAYIQGVQSRGVVATVKHFDANNSEYDRHNIDEHIDERTLREIYLPAFEAAVKEGHAGAVMDSYNLVNGEHATQNGFLNVQVLKREWGFQGILMSDWSATYDGVAAANNGLDLEMPSAQYMNLATLLPAVAQGRVSIQTIDDKVRRILRTALEFHFLERPQYDPSVPLYSQDSRQVALASAEESVVLLKNDGGLLPIDRRKVRSIAVIGPDAYPPVVGAGGSSQVTAFAPVGLLTGLSDALGRSAKVTYAQGVEDYEQAARNAEWWLAPQGERHGLREASFATSDFTGPAQRSVIPRIDRWGGSPFARGRAVHVSQRFTGYIRPKKTAGYVFFADALGRDTYRLYVNGREVLEETPHEHQYPQFATVPLRAGVPALVQFDYVPAGEGLAADVGVAAADELVDPKAVQLAAAADLAVVSVGFDYRYEGEAFDRTYGLPVGQDALIRAIEAANPRTVVVLTAGGSVATQAWIDGTPALLHAFYGGQEEGRALARILLGESNPSGHLPFTFERRIQDDPAYANYYEPPGSNVVTYKEGIFIGYRYFDHAGVKPLFPFGYGLSYTRFAFSHLAVGPVGPDDAVTVRCSVTNTGPVAGAAVAQVYVGDPSATVERPVRELKGFARVFLRPGETRPIAVQLNRRSFAYWDVASHGWKVDPGRFTVSVGDSSANLPLHADLTLP